jgi:hypothetical protein
MPHAVHMSETAVSVGVPETDINSAAAAHKSGDSSRAGEHALTNETTPVTTPSTTTANDLYGVLVRRLPPLEETGVKAAPYLAFQRNRKVTVGRHPVST